MDYNDCVIEDEIDASVVFKQAASNLSTVKSLGESLNRFGYTEDDRIERRELVLMYSSIKGEMEQEIHTLAHDSAYDEAKEMRTRLNSLKDEFSGLQTNGARLVRSDQCQHFEKASSTLLQEAKKRHSIEEHEVLEICNQLRQDLAKTHEIEIENLEKKIARTHKPHTKYSKRLIELLKAESGLIKLCEYEEARKVRNMIDKILPGEVKANDKVFERKNQLQREMLRKAHIEDEARLEEKIKALMWKDKRRRESDYAREEQRVKNHQKDMEHAHFLESRLRPEMSVKPSALWQKRPGYQNTSASMRGSQLLDAVRGKKEGDEVFADSLVDKHDFRCGLADTITLERK